MTGLNFTDPYGTVDKSEDVNTLAQMVIADVTFSETPKVPDLDVMFGVVSHESFFAMAPLHILEKGSKESRGKTVFRIACGIPLSAGSPPSNPSVEYCQGMLEKFGPHALSCDKSKNPNAVSISDVVWSTRFRTRCAVAEKFFTRSGGKDASSGASICLIGDAAHIHPPAGGQGMNLGLRDGISLGPVIAAALTAGTSPETDETVRAHMAVRYERAVKVIGMTKLMSGAVGMSPTLAARFSWSPVNIYTIRDWVCWTLSKSSWIRESIAYGFSGLGAP